MTVGSDPGVLDFRGLWGEAIPYERFAAEVADLRALWHGVYRTARIPDWAIESAGSAGSRRLLCITEDWCWDAANTVPLVAKLCDAVDDLELRTIRRDEYPAVMDRYLTDGSRSIPIVVVLDGAFAEFGRWGPRPHELQQWAATHREGLEKSEFYAQMRRWYVKDKGESTLREVLDVLLKGRKGRESA
jgi:hypothetical protein